MNVILDIDETFVQFVGKDDWATIPDEDKAKYKTYGQQDKDGKDRNGFFILRPHFDEFFDFLFKNCRTVNLWTLSDQEYADGVAKMIASRNPKWKIANVWADTHNEQAENDYGGRKNIKWIHDEMDNSFQPFNTILIDDLPKNTQHKANINNGIQLKPFDPLGEALPREKRKPGSIRENHYKDLTKDDTLLRVIEKLKSVINKPPFEGSTKVGGRRRAVTRKNRRY